MTPCPGGGSLPGSGVVLSPDADVFVQVVGAQDGGVARQVLKIVHDDSDKEVQHLGGHGRGGVRVGAGGLGSPLHLPGLTRKEQRKMKETK